MALTLSLLAPTAGNVLEAGHVAARPFPLNASYTVIVKATFTGGATAPTQDSITFDNQTNTGNKTGSGNTATYTAKFGVTWDSESPPPSGLQACSAVLNNKCSGKVTATPGSHTITITGSTSHPGNGSGDSNNQSASPECTTSNDPLSWIICPIFQGAADMSEWILNTIITPFLLTSPIDTSASNPLYQVWSNFRIYGDIFLVIALLVLVFGQSIGGGLVDAYTVKKALPRVLAAAILVNLSIYIVAFMIDVTNIIGKSIGDILVAPFKTAGAWHFTPNAAQGIGVLSVGIIGYFLARGGIFGFLKALFTPPEGANSRLAAARAAIGHGSFARDALEAGLLVAIPMVLAILAVFVTLLIRKGLILFLVLISPVAFALYALPNTQQYFRKWWDLLLEALMVFPIIMIIFAMADILSITILDANSINPQNITTTGATSAASILAIIVAIVLQFLPLFIIPFAFRMAGGVLGRMHEWVANTHGKVANLAGYKQAREHALQRVSDKTTQARHAAQQRYDDLADSQSDTRLGRLNRRRLQRRAMWAGGRGVEQKIAEINKRKAEEQALNTGYGPDDARRGSMIDGHMLDIANRQGEQGLVNAGYVAGSDYRMVDDGDGKSHLELATIGGKFYGLGTANRARREFAGDTAAMQYNLQYEMSKTSEEWQDERILSRYGAWAQSQGWDNNTANERWIGAAFGSQQKQKNYKYYSLDANGNMRPVNALGQITEMNRLQGSWEHGKFSANTYNDLARNVALAADVMDGTRTEAGMFTNDRAGTTGAQTAHEKAQQYLEEVGKHVHFLESPQAQRTEDGQIIPGSTSRMLYGGNNDTSQAAQALANTFHNRGGKYVSQVEAEAQGGTAPLPQRQRTFAGPGTEATVSQQDRPGEPARTGQMRTDTTRPEPPENPEGHPVAPAPAHLYPEGRTLDPGVRTGTATGPSSYTRNPQFADRNPQLFEQPGTGRTGLQTAPPPPSPEVIQGPGGPARAGDGAANPAGRNGAPPQSSN